MSKLDVLSALDSILSDDIHYSHRTLKHELDTALIYVATHGFLPKKKPERRLELWNLSVSKDCVEFMVKTVFSHLLDKLKSMYVEEGILLEFKNIGVFRPSFMEGVGSWSETREFEFVLKFSKLHPTFRAGKRTLPLPSNPNYTIKWTDVPKPSNDVPVTWSDAIGAFSRTPVIFPPLPFLFKEP